ncbi:hypothetical protein M079_3640 [Bacteroides fragilis str. 3996 N(B) 6]|uniref:Uncharacterized protein n=1 Tax=Bacteroides fragilis str. 3998T(B)3 TaxID=1339316 RepID=A0A015U357_BACFG|nr:hypothetical protein M079_3640 [Bacteroides fragilis str. 3996 N(B) 6]EXY89202.1 hypothetical protein M125_4130 [Bacteroides fragilis str. 3998T(B)3]
MLYGRQNVLFSIILLNYQKGVKYLFPLTLPIFFRMNRREKKHIK